MASWSILQSVKTAVVAYPFHLIDIYIKKYTKISILIKQLAARISTAKKQQDHRLIGSLTNGGLVYHICLQKRTSRKI